MKGLILSGGKGIRLRPLTYTIAKQLLPVANKPVLFYIIEKLAASGITDVGIILGDNHEDMKKVIGDGGRWGINLTFIHQPEPLGLAHAVKTASDFLDGSDFIMVLGDNLFQMDLKDMVDGFHESRANASILLHRVEDPSHFGVAEVGEGKVRRVVEKPRTFISSLIITGVYIFDKSIFAAIDRIKPSQRGELEITDAIQKLIEMGGMVTYTLIEGWWKDTGRPQDLIEANRLVLDDMEGSMPAELDSDLVYSGRIRTGANTEVIKSILLGPVTIGSRTVISNSIIGPYASIGDNCLITGCEIDNSILLEGTRLENVSRKISSSIIGKRAVIKERESGSGNINYLLGDSSEIYF